MYLGGGQMQAALYNNDPLTHASDACNSVTVELHDALSPTTSVASVITILKTDGNASVRFPASIANNSYYIVLKFRNAIETWSKVPVAFNSPEVTFDFTTP